MQDDDIESIIEQLNCLTVQQQQLTEQITNLQIEVHNRSNNDLQVEQDVTTTVRAKRNNKSIKIGDRVNIKNPKKNQSNIGTVISFTPTGLFASVKLENDIVINRAPRNLTHINNEL